jgi:hypothetical protein
MDEEGRTIKNSSGEYLCAESLRPYNKEVEAKMRDAAKHCGIDGGKPYWRPGEKISHEEYEEQMALLKLGILPDYDLYG